jgi:hypothetical protein
MPITFVASSTGSTTASAKTSTQSLTRPAYQANDVATATFAVGGLQSALLPSPPTGWTLVKQSRRTSTDRAGLLTYVKVMGASEPASYSWIFDHTNADTAKVVGVLAVWRGVDTMNPIAVVSSGETSGGSNSVGHPSVTTPVDGCVVVITGAADQNPTATPPAGVTPLYNGATNGGGQAAAVMSDYFTQAVAGATPTYATGISSVVSWSADTFALRPAATAQPGAELSTTAVGGSSVSAAGLSLNHALMASASGGSSVAIAGLRFEHALASMIVGVSAVDTRGLALDHALRSSVAGQSDVRMAGLTLEHALITAALGSSLVEMTLSVGAAGAMLSTTIAAGSNVGIGGLVISHALATAIEAGTTVRFVVQDEGEMIYAIRFIPRFQPVRFTPRPQRLRF